MISVIRYSMLSILLLTIIGVVNEIPRAIASTHVSMNIQDLCPVVDFCTTEAQMRIPDGLALGSCCFACFCSDFCWARGDCCVDVSHAPPENIADLKAAVQCEATSYIYEYGHWEPVPEKMGTFDYLHIWMISICTGSATDHPYAELCSGTSNSSLVNLVAVWSPSTRDVYRNQYCALCYNVTDYQSLSIDIGDITGYLDEDENVTWGAIEYILTHSTTANTFKIYPADQLRFAMPYCNIGPVISECRDDYDVGPLGVVIRQQCDNGPFHPYIIEEFDVITDSRVDVHAIYKNVYCTICHSELHDAQSISFQSCIFRQSILSWAETKPVSNPKQYTAPQKIRRLLCEATEIMDPYMHRCRQLVCPNFSLAYNGACYYTHIDDEPRTVSYLVEPGIDLPPTEIMRYLEHIFSGYRYLRNHPLYVCSVELANNDTGELSTSNGYYVSIGFQAHGRSEWYSYRHIRDADQFIATERKFGYQLPARLLKGVDARTSQYTTRWLDPDRKQCNGTFSVIEVWCPTIELSESDIAYCETRGVLPKYFEFNNPSEIARDRSVARQICVQDYLRLWANASIANRFYVGPFAHTILTYSLIACFLFQQV